MEIEVCPLDELPPGTMKLVPRRARSTSASTTAAGRLYAIEDHCSHDDGPLCEGDWEPEECVVVCPRHGARFDIAHRQAADAAGVPARGDVSGLGSRRMSSSKCRRTRPLDEIDREHRHRLRMLDDRVRAVLARLEDEDARERERGRSGGAARHGRSRRRPGDSSSRSSRANAGCEVLEIGGSRGYSTIWLAAAARILGGSVVSLEHDPEKMRGLAARTSPRPASRSGRSCSRAMRSRRCGRLEEPFDVVFLDAEKEDYERLFALARARLEPGRAGRRRQRALTRGHARPRTRPRGRPTRPCSASPSPRPRARAQRRPVLKL